MYIDAVTGAQPSSGVSYPACLAGRVAFGVGCTHMHGALKSHFQLCEL